MMKRKIITINENKCTGCGQCIPDCPEGALQLIDGKARLVSDLFCDGLGACIGTCPEGAICVVEREAGAYDEKAVMENIVPQGGPVIRAHLEHLLSHGQKDLYNEAIEYLIEHMVPIPDHDNSAIKTAAKHQVPAHVNKSGVCSPGPDGRHPFAGCPGSAPHSIVREIQADERKLSSKVGSELRQWPIQLALLNPTAPYFDNADLLISADCVPFAYGDFHQDFLRNRIVIMFCPKLDSDIEGYIVKLAEIFRLHPIKSIMVLRMEVPCCGGVRFVVDKALAKAGVKIPVEEKTITIQGVVE
jgi:NAD-dependent dihydropyrimidine dehydrogenase PreA subunit